MKDEFADRWYQQTAIKAVPARWAAGDRGTAVDMATGTGKTRVLAGVGAHVFDNGGRTLLTAHREFLIDDNNGGGAYYAFRRDRPTMQVHYEKNVDKVSDYDIATGRPDVVMGMVQSIHRRLDKYPSDFFTHLMFDEGHRAAANTYIKIIRHFPNAKVLLTSATFERSDGKSVRGHTHDEKTEKAYRRLTKISCQSVAFSFPMGMAEHDGWICRPKCKPVKIAVDWSKLRVGKDYSAKQIDQLMKEDEPLHQVALGLVGEVAGKHGVVFMAGVDSAIALAKLLREGYGVRAEVIHGKTDPRLKPDIIRRFKAHEFDCLVNVAVATEGFDDPTIEYVAIVRPTRSLSVYLQMMGRGCRTLDGVVDGWETAEERKAAIAASAKPRYILLDFEGNLGSLPKPITGNDVLLGELPHHDYGNQPTPKDRDVAGVLDKHPELSIEEARQRASDELYEIEVLQGWRSKARAEAKHVDLKEFDDFWSIPFIYKPKKKRTRRKPPPGTEATPKMKALFKSIYIAATGKLPDEDWIDSLTRGKCGAMIGSYKKRLAKKQEKEAAHAGVES